MQQGGTAGSPAVDAFAYTCLPELVPIQVKAENPGLAKENKEVFSIGDRGAGGIAVVGAFSLVIMFGQLRFECLGDRLYRHMER